MATMSYKVFLEKLGLESIKYRKFVPEPPKLALGWQGISPPNMTKQRNRAASQNATGDTQEIQGLTQDKLQTLFLKKRIGRITTANLGQALEVPQYNLRGPQAPSEPSPGQRAPDPAGPRAHWGHHPAQPEAAQPQEGALCPGEGDTTHPLLEDGRRRSWRMWLR